MSNALLKVHRPQFVDFKKTEYVKIAGILTILGERSDNVLMFPKMQSIWAKKELFPLGEMELICATIV